MELPVTDCWKVQDERNLRWVFGIFLNRRWFTGESWVELSRVETVLMCLWLLHTLQNHHTRKISKFSFREIFSFRLFRGENLKKKTVLFCPRHKSIISSRALGIDSTSKKSQRNWKSFLLWFDVHFWGCRIIFGLEKGRKGKFRIFHRKPDSKNSFEYKTLNLNV